MKSKKPGIRSQQEFIEDQERFLQRKYDNLKTAIIKEEISENYTFQPEINKKSVKMLQNVQIDPVELAKIRRMQKEAAIIQEREKAAQFRPQINESSKQMRRGVAALTEDAKRRQQWEEDKKFLRSQQASQNLA